MAETFVPLTATGLDGSIISVINNNFSTIATLFNDVLSRSGSTPNQMTNNLDMNNSLILNLPTPTNNAHAASKSYVDTALSKITSASLPLLGIWSNVVNAKSANYTVTNGDSGTTFVLTGGGNTLTFNAAGTYIPNFITMVINQDSVRAWNIILPGQTSFFLYPGQSTLIFAQNSIWQSIREKRWRPTSATFYVDGTNGNDVNDGLASGTSAFATVQKALNTLQLSVDTGVSSNTFTINVANGTYGNTQCVGPFTGSGVVTLVGNTGSPTSCLFSGGSLSGFQILNGAQLQLKGFSFQSTNLNGLEVTDGAFLRVLGPIDFGPCGGTQLFCTRGARFWISFNVTLHGNATNYVQVSHQAQYRQDSGITISLTANATYSQPFVLADNGEWVSTGGCTFSLGGFTCTAVQWSEFEGGRIQMEGFCPPLDGALLGNTVGTSQYGSTLAQPGFYLQRAGALWLLGSAANGIIFQKSDNSTFNAIIDDSGNVSTKGTETLLSTLSIPAGGTLGKGYMFSSTANFGVFFGSGAPTLAAAKGSLYLRSDGNGTGNRAYINTDGGSTWTALTTAA